MIYYSSVISQWFLEIIDILAYFCIFERILLTKKDQIGVTWS